jgi:hypothetical protein
MTHLLSIPNSGGNDVEMPMTGHEIETTVGDARTSHPGMWSIKFQQLLDVADLAEVMFGHKSYKLKSMRAINEAIIIPKCGRNGVSYSQMLNPGGCWVEAFITHCWDEPFADFVNSIRNAFRPFTRKPNLWICAFAIQQGDHQTIERQLGADLRESPFAQALSRASWFVVVRNSRTDLYNRACVCAVSFACLLHNGLQHYPCSCSCYLPPELMFASGFGFTTTHRTMVIGPNNFSHVLNHLAFKRKPPILETRSASFPHCRRGTWRKSTT